MWALVGPVAAALLAVSVLDPLGAVFDPQGRTLHDRLADIRELVLTEIPRILTVGL